jgi:hypothetical protein
MTDGLEIQHIQGLIEIWKLKNSVAMKCVEIFSQSF